MITNSKLRRKASSKHNNSVSAQYYQKYCGWYHSIFNNSKFLIENLILVKYHLDIKTYHCNGYQKWELPNAYILSFSVHS